VLLAQLSGLRDKWTLVAKENLVLRSDIDSLRQAAMEVGRTSESLELLSIPRHTRVE
jgi:hypothetical protein